MHLFQKLKYSLLYRLSKTKDMFILTNSVKYAFNHLFRPTTISPIPPSIQSFQALLFPPSFALFLHPSLFHSLSPSAPVSGASVSIKARYAGQFHTLLYSESLLLSIPASYLKNGRKGCQSLKQKSEKRRANRTGFFFY